MFSAGSPVRPGGSPAPDLASDLAPDEVVVGRVGRPHGVHGEVSIELRTDEPDRRFTEGAALRVVAGAAAGAARPGPAYDRLTVAATRWHAVTGGDRLLVRFREIGDRTAAEAARGLLLTATVNRGEEPEDPEEFYDHQIVGLAVLTTEGTAAGTVAEVLHAGAQDLLVVRRGGRDDALVPFVSALVPEVDLAGGRLVVADRPGLLEPFGPSDED